MRKRIRVLGVLAAAVAGLVWSGYALPSAGAEGELLGKALGDALGLIPQPTTGAKCNGWFAEYADGIGFCLDSVADTGLAGYEIALRIAGVEPTEVDRQLFLCDQELETLYDAGIATDDPQMLQQIEKCTALRIQQEEQRSASG